MYKKILVPLDGSKRAEMIRPHVRALASRFQAKVVLMMVIEPTALADGCGQTVTSISEEVLKAKIAEAGVYLDGVKAKLHNKGIDCKTLVAHGPVVETIVSAAESENADLIAMTSHGRGGISRLFYGSVAAGILNRVDRPLFIIRSRWTEKTELS